MIATSHMDFKSGWFNQTIDLNTNVQADLMSILALSSLKKWSNGQLLSVNNNNDGISYDYR